MKDLSLPSDHHVTVFGALSTQALARRVCAHLGIAPGGLEEREFEDGEHKSRPLESVRGRDVYIVESLYGDPQRSVNDKLARVLFLIAAMNDLGARRVTMVAPYLCYSRKDMRTKPRDPVTTRYVASLFEAVGAHRIVCMDVHNRAAYENAFRIPAEHLTATPAFTEHLARMVAARSAAVVSPDAGGVKRAERLRGSLEKRLGAPVPLAFIEKFRSEGKVRGGAAVGSVEGRVAIIVDDLISSGTTLALAAEACRQRGAAAVYAAVTHGVFAREASDVLRRSSIERLLMFDTIPPERLEPDLLQSRVEIIDCAPLLASAIRRLHTDGSLGELERG